MEGDRDYSTIDEITNPDTAAQGGIGVSIPLHLYNTHDYYGKLCGLVRLTLLPTHQIYDNNTNRVTSVNSIYIHDTRVSPGTSFTFDITENSHVNISAPGSFDSVSATANTYYREP